MEFFAENTVTVLLIIGLACLSIEVAVLGFSTLVLFFVGIASITVAGMVSLGVIDSTSLTEIIAGVVFLTAVLAVILWKPMKSMQNHVSSQKVTSDFIGLTFSLTDDIGPALQSKYRYSGIEWRVEANTPIPAGTQVEVVEIDVGVMRVVSLDNSPSKTD